MQTSCATVLTTKYGYRRFVPYSEVFTRCRPFSRSSSFALSPSRPHLHHPSPVVCTELRNCRLGSRQSIITCCETSESEGGESNPDQNGSTGGSNTNNSPPPHHRRQEPDKPSWSPWSWIARLATHLRLQQLILLLFNIQLLFFLLRLWPLSGKPVGHNTQTVNIAVPFSDFISKVKSNDVDGVVMDGQEMTFTLRPNSRFLKDLPQSDAPTKLTYKTIRPSDYATPYDILENHGVKFTSQERRGGLLITAMVYAVYIGLLLTSFGRLQLNFPQRSIGRKHQNAATSSDVKFDDVAGVDEAKEELEEIVEFLKNPEKFSKLGASPPCGVLLVGPPGTGKTMLARAVAGEANVPFFSIAASEFVELYVGMGAMRVRELFTQARKEAPAIVFIDEIDAVAKGRDSRLRGVGNDEREQTLNQLLTELDGFETNKENVVICLAATNRPDVLDAALLRPGRFDRRVAVQQPDKVGREEILRVHMDKKKLPLADDVTIESIALPTTGFTGADLANLVNEAALLAGRKGHSKVTKDDFDSAILRAMAGIEKKRSLVTGLEKSVVSKHEVGHALVGTAIARLVPSSAEVEKLSIVPRVGGALGFTYIPPVTEDRLLIFDSEVRARLAIALGGRAAEMLTCDDVSTGASDDIKKATSLAYEAISEYGLSKVIGPLNVSTLLQGASQDGFFARDSSKLSGMVEEEVKILIDAALTVALDVVTQNLNIHEGLSAALEKEERLEGPALQDWLKHIDIPSSLQQFVLDGTLPGQSEQTDEPAETTTAGETNTMEAMTSRDEDSSS